LDDRVKTHVHQDLYRADVARKLQCAAQAQRSQKVSACVSRFPYLVLSFQLHLYLFIHNDRSRAVALLLKSYGIDDRFK
jgi:hypothetical protein